MNDISESELQDLVKQVVNRTMNESGDSAALHVTVEKERKIPTPLSPNIANNSKKISLGADHGGFEMKEHLKIFLKDQGYEVIDCGTHSKDSVDYPDFAYAAAKLVSDSETWRGIIIDGAGIGSCMVANKIPGVRAAMCYDHASAHNSREHNDANVLTLGSGMIGINIARQIVQTWLTTQFAGGRHAKRVDKIIAVEDKFLKKGIS